MFDQYLAVAKQFTTDESLATEIAQHAVKGLKDGDTVKKLGAIQRDARVTQQGLYKALVGVGKPAPTDTGKAEKAPKAPKAGKAAKVPVAKAAKEPKAEKPATTRPDGFALTKEQCAEQKLVCPPGVLWRAGTNVYKMHLALAGEFKTPEQVYASVPELKSASRYLAEFESELKIGPAGYKFESTGEKAERKVRIVPNPEFKIADGCDILI